MPALLALVSGAGVAAGKSAADARGAFVRRGHVSDDGASSTGATDDRLHAAPVAFQRGRLLLLFTTGSDASLPSVGRRTARAAENRVCGARVPAVCGAAASSSAGKLPAHANDLDQPEPRPVDRPVGAWACLSLHVRHLDLEAGRGRGN